MTVIIHAVKAVYSAPTFNASVSIQTDEPLRYDCLACNFSGNLEEAVGHVVTNQFDARFETDE